jgi:bifunctional DNA-binding transcriptional regulator/antitoxin component of YhaV-PrlF toxin-antitoxin module
MEVREVRVLKFQSKNQITLPREVIEQFYLERGDILKCEVDGVHIILTPVDLEERYFKSSLEAIDRIVKEGKGKGYSLRTDQDIEGYIEEMRKENQEEA